MTIAEAAQSAECDYVLYQAELDYEARDMASKGAPLTSGMYRNWARIAGRAAKAEKADPMPDIRPCHICCGIRACDIPAHLLRMDR